MDVYDHQGINIGKVKVEIRVLIQSYDVRSFNYFLGLIFVFVGESLVLFSSFYNIRSKRLLRVSHSQSSLLLSIQMLAALL